MRTYLLVTNPNKYEFVHDVEERSDEICWNCNKSTKSGDRLLVYLTANIGIMYEWVEWVATSDAEKDKEWKYACDIKYVRKYDPPITLKDIRDIVTEDEWKPPYLNLRGYKSIRIPDYIAERIIDLR